MTMFASIIPAIREARATGKNQEVYYECDRKRFALLTSTATELYILVDGEKRLVEIEITRIGR